VGSKTEVLEELAAAIADSSEIDWKRVEDVLGTSAELRLLEPLRLIARIAATQRRQNANGSLSAPAGDASGTTQDDPLDRPEPELQQWGGLIIVEEVGRGSFGTVYRAHDPQLDLPVALKLLRYTTSSDGQAAARLLNEARTLARLNHDNVVRVYGAGEHDGRLGLWMEFIHGVTLESMIRNHGPLSAGEAALVAYELCGALAAVHHAGLVHRDVKTQNVMREEGGRLVLMDFGAGRKIADPEIEMRRVVGTPLYLAPEVLAGAEATVCSDIYSLGVLMYHVVTNDFPVKGATLEELTRAHERGDMTPLQDARPQLPHPFVGVVERALHRDPARRFASAGRMEAALARVLGSTGTRTAAPRLRTSRPTGKRNERQKRDASHASVAVLPFTDMSAAKDQESFCDGLAEELINALTQIAGLRVAARTSTFRFKGQAHDVRQIGDALNVATVLDGSVQKHGNRLRVTVELIGSADGYHLWSQRFDRETADIFDVQDEIAGSIVNTLKGTLTDPADIRLRGTRNLAAYEAYLQGRYHWNKRTEDELNKSVACFEEAIDHDPGFARALAGAADAYVTLGTYGVKPAAEVMPRAREAVDRALALDDRLAEAYACRGCVRSIFDWAWSDGERDFQRAIELQPSYPTAHHWYAINHLVPLGRFDEADRELGRALELDPLALAIKSSLGIKAYFAGQYDAAVRDLTNTIELDGSFGIAHFFLGAAFTEQGDYPVARIEIEAARRLLGATPEILAGLGYLHAVAGDGNQALIVLDQMRRLSAERYISPARLAQVHAGLGEMSAALDCLEQAQAERAADVAWLGVRPVFARLRGEPRFAALLDKSGLSVSG
jgi:serine/threonine protein kinase/tetratricopeptide (TPR) repeat protein